MEVTLLPIVKVVKFEQFKNAETLMVFTLLEIVTAVNPLQSENDWLPIEITLLPMDRAVKHPPLNNRRKLLSLRHEIY